MTYSAANASPLAEDDPIEARREISGTHRGDHGDRGQHPWAAGTTLRGGYRLERVLGHGGFAVVYEATHPELGLVAIKILDGSTEDGEASDERFVREAEIAASVDHPNVLGVHEIRRAQDGSPFLVMELLFGKDLSELVARQRLDLPAVVELGLQLSSAVAALDAAGIIHRDLKPHNVLMHRVGRTVRPMLIDFGIATNHEDGAFAQVHQVPKLTQTGIVLGTPHYLPPEQARGEPLDVRADLYALGILMYESLCGRTPFEDDNISALMASVLRDERPRVTDFRPDCPEGFADILAKAIHRDREERFQTPAELIATLEAYAQSEGLVRGDAAFSGLCLSHEMTLPWALRDLAPREKAAKSRSVPVPLRLPESERSCSPSGESSPPPAARERVWRLFASSVRRHVVSWTAVIGVVVGFGLSAFVGVEDGGVPPTVKAPVRADSPSRRAAAMPVVLAHPPPASLTTALPGRDDARPADEAREDVLAEPNEGESSSARRSPLPDALDSPTAQTLERRAHRAYVRGRLADARTLYERATRTDPRYGAAWRGYGLVAVQMGRKAEARRALRRYLVLEPGSSDADSIRRTLASL